MNKELVDKICKMAKENDFVVGSLKSRYGGIKAVLYSKQALNPFGTPDKQSQSQESLPSK